jgi:hypothetical protein
MNKDKPNEKNSPSKDPARDRTRVEGQNPKANDSPDHDEHHDESRRNMYDPEVGKALHGSDKQK